MIIKALVWGGLSVEPLAHVCIYSNLASVPSALCLELELYLLSGCDVTLV